jgi:hypothetical protein
MTDRTKVMIAIAGTALVVGGTTAVAAGGSGGGSASAGSTSAPAASAFAGAGQAHAFRGRGRVGGLHGDVLGAAATYLGLTRQQLVDQLAAGKSLAQVAAAQSGKTVDGLKAAIKGEAKADVDADVAAGRVSAAERDAFLAALDARIDELVARTGFPGGRGGPGFGHGHHGAPFAGAAVATYLGLTEAQLAEQLRAGKSLAEIAAAQGKTVAGLKDAIVAAAKEHLDQDVKEGHLTAAQAAQRLTELKSRLDEIVQNKGFGPPGARGHDYPGKTAGFRPAVRA